MNNNINISAAAAAAGGGGGGGGALVASLASSPAVVVPTDRDIIAGRTKNFTYTIPGQSSGQSLGQSSGQSAGTKYYYKLIQSKFDEYYQPTDDDYDYRTVNNYNNNNNNNNNNNSIIDDNYTTFKILAQKQRRTDTVNTIIDSCKNDKIISTVTTATATATATATTTVVNNGGGDGGNSIIYLPGRFIQQNTTTGVLEEMENKAVIIKIVSFCFVLHCVFVLF
jgi:hypothetical protein